MQEEKVDLSQFTWMNRPETVEMTPEGLELVTMPRTDFWQRTHCGECRSNGHAFLTRLWDDFSFSVQTEFFYENTFDQCGLLLYVDDDNWAKASLEFQDESYGLLGSVVTAFGYSDWSSVLFPITLNSRLFYRISRRGADFMFEYALDGANWQQMRVFHVHADLSIARVGIYACSPEDSVFRARFGSFMAGPSKWTK